jgi:hypothetical protein
MTDWDQVAYENVRLHAPADAPAPLRALVDRCCASDP